MEGRGIEVSELPDDVLFIIIRHLSAKEGARTCILSRRWGQLWRKFWPCLYSGVFIFDDRFSSEKYSPDPEEFVRKVNRVLEQNLSPSIEGFQISCIYDFSYQSHIDKWVDFALAKGAQTLVLELHGESDQIEKPSYTFPLNCCLSPYNTLKTLALKNVNLTTQLIGYILESHPRLEDLRIDSVQGLETISALGSPLALRHLDLKRCFGLLNIELLAPKLLTFKIMGHPRKVVLHAPLLYELTIYERTPVHCLTLDTLGHYVCRVQRLIIPMEDTPIPERLYLNPSPRDLFFFEGITLCYTPELTNVKHLTLQGCGSLFGWTHLISHAPQLHKLTLELRCNEFCNLKHESTNIWIRSPWNFHRLKILELWLCWLSKSH